MNPTNKIKVLIVDDHDMVRKSLSILLKSFGDFEVVADVSDAQMGITLCLKYQPDVVLMDVLMPGLDGIAATEIIRQRWPHIQVVALTSAGDDHIIRDVLKAGAISFLTKNGSIDEVADAVRAAYCQHATLSESAIQTLVASTQHPHRIGYDLTKRQQEVLSLMVCGLSNSQIAKELVVSQSTVKNHICGIYAKLNTANRTQTVALAIKNHLAGKAG
jgi:NarL family two-component system response regulator LiaR